METGLEGFPLSVTPGTKEMATIKKKKHNREPSFSTQSRAVGFHPSLLLTRTPWSVVSHSHFTVGKSESLGPGPMPCP